MTKSQKKQFYIPFRKNVTLNRGSEMGLFLLFWVAERIFSKLPYNSKKKILYPKLLIREVSLDHILPFNIL